MNRSRASIPLLSLALAACSTSSSGPTQAITPDGGVHPDASVRDSGSRSDATSDANDASDAAGSNDGTDDSSPEAAPTCGVMPDLDGGACNAVALSGNPVTPTCATGSPPALNGGTIVDGTYVLTSATSYATACNPTPATQTLSIAGPCIQAVIESLGSKQSQTFEIQPNASMLEVMILCPTTEPVTAEGYAATATTLTLYSPANKYLGVYTKQ